MLYPECFGVSPLYPSRNDFQVVSRDTDSGLGVICYRRFAPGQVVAAITGEIVSEIMQHTLQIEPGMHLLDLYFSGYFLHACEPKVSVDMRNRIVTALRPIQPGDFITMDYAETEDVLFKQFACRCGSARCRGWITGRRESVPLGLALTDGPSAEELVV